MTKANAKHFSAGAIAEPSVTTLELVCPVSSLASLRAAVNHGADCVRLQHRDEPGFHSLSSLGSHATSLGKAIRYAHDKDCRVVMAVEGRAGGDWRSSCNMIDRAVHAGIDAVELSDPSLLLYAAAQHAGVALHFRPRQGGLSVKALNLSRVQFGVTRIVLPRVLSLKHLTELARDTTTELQVFGFGRLCTLLDSREEESVESFLRRLTAPVMPVPGQPCAAAEDASNDISYAQHLPPDAGTLRLLPQLAALRVHAITVEAQDRSPAGQAQVTRVWREAIDECREGGGRYAVKPSWITELNAAANRAGQQ
jgi:collagenase-like PrtC family protease